MTLTALLMSGTATLSLSSLPTATQLATAFTAITAILSTAEILMSFGKLSITALLTVAKSAIVMRSPCILPLNARHAASSR